MLRPSKIINYCFLALLSFALVLGIGVIPVHSTSIPPDLASNPSALEQQAQQLYEDGQFDRAAQLLKQAAADYAASGDKLGQARQLRNLALAYQQMGKLTLANETIQESINYIQASKNNGAQRERKRLLAQTLEVKGKLQLDAGQSEQALETWKQTANSYQQLDDLAGITRSKINQSQALQRLGLYRQALKTLTGVRNTLQAQPDSLLKAKGLQSLGEALRVVGDLKRSQEVLEQSLALAEKLQLRDSLAAILISLGNTAYVQQKPDDALGFYQRAAQASPSPTLKLQAQLNQLRVLVDEKKESEASTLAPQIQTQLADWPPSRTAIYARINLAESFRKMGNPKESQLPIANSQNFAQLLATAVQQAQSLNDERAEAYALGSLGGLYEQNQQWDNAQKLTEQALLLAQGINAADIAYQWQWQLGRILRAKGSVEGATAAYTQAVNTLQSIRSDLVAISSDVQFSFRQSVEPVYREFVALLLQPKGGKSDQKDLAQARKVIESLQLAELDNFFRDACINAKPAQIDQIDKTAAVFYPIILPDRLEVILALPGQPLRQYTTALPKQTINKTLRDLRDAVTVPRYRISVKRFHEPAQKVYNWLIRPVEAELANSGIKTLAFVPDGLFRNIPLSALYDGKHYLVEKYSVAIAPGLQLVDPKPLVRKELKVLAFGLTESRSGFSPLPNVQSEMDRIKGEVESQVRLNQSFTNSSFKEATESSEFPVIHLATHGQFSSSAQDTFVLTWDDRIRANDFSELLRAQQGNQKQPIELLVLSACQTASGDDRAALGLAGVAVRAGARSTLASLWFVSDEATSLLMSEFYQELSRTQDTKAEALRRAQMAILHQQDFSHPYFWSAFVLVGNWL
jgi:CHAT domain-containing protein